MHLESRGQGQRFAFGFLQIPPRDGHPCRSADRSPCRANSGLAPPGHPATTTRTGTAPVTAHMSGCGRMRCGCGLVLRRLPSDVQRAAGLPSVHCVGDSGGDHGGCRPGRSPARWRRSDSFYVPCGPACSVAVRASPLPLDGWFAGDALQATAAVLRHGADAGGTADPLGFGDGAAVSSGALCGLLGSMPFPVGFLPPPRHWKRRGSPTLHR